MRSSARLLRFTLPFTSLLATGACAIALESAPSTGTPGLVGRPGDNYGETRRYLASLRFDGTRSRSPLRCHSGQSVELEISPERNSHQVDPVDAARKGRIVAMIKNVGTATCDDLKLAPGDSAYWWMGGDGSRALTVVFWSIPPQGPIRPLARTGDVIWHHDGQRPAASAVISEHLVHPPGDDDGGEDAVFRFGHNSTWIACLDGCCEATNVEAFTAT